MPKNADPKTVPTPAPPADFESAMQELERIVAQMESSDLSLEASLAAHRRGLELARFCQDLLTNAQQQVTVMEESMLRMVDENPRNGD